MKFHIFTAKLRVKIMRLFNRALLGKHAGGLPGTVIRSLEEVYGQPLSNDYLIDMRKVSPAQVFRFTFPDNYPPLFRREKAFDAKHVYFLRNVIVSPESGIAWTSTGHILQESVGSLQRMMGWGGVLHELLLSQDNEPITETVIACPDTGYFHWLLEIMPNVLDALKIEPEARIFISPNRSTYVTDAIAALFGPKAIEERCIERRGPKTCVRLLLPTCEAFSGFVHPRSVEMLRKAFQPKEKDKMSDPGRKIYISRRDTSKRAVENEKELEDALKSSFEIVCLERLSFCEQIELMRQASVIVAMHGAGLSNMIWARKPCHIVEVFPIDCYNDCFARLALTCGYDYQMIRCKKGQRGTNGRIPVSEVVYLIESTISYCVRDGFDIENDS
jgi:Capsular polysaccharide biosynthesis protein